MSQLYVFDEVLEEIVRRKAIKDAGGHIGIPYPFAGLNNDLGGIEEDCVVGITANSGVSKSKFTRFVYIYNVYKFYKRTNYKVQIIYFPLEDSHKDVLHNMICFYLKDLYDINIKIQELNQMGDFDLNSYVISKIREARAYFADLYEILRVVDDAFTVTEIFNTCKLWAGVNGTVKYRKDEETGVNHVVGYKKSVDIHTIIIVDNLSNILPEAKHKYNKHTAIGDLAANVSRTILAKIFKFTVVLVQQQSQAKEKVQFANNGRLLYEKFEPSLGDLGDNLETQRAFHICFGIFSPDRYNLEEYWNYDIKVLGGFFRSIKILKSNRSGVTDKIIPLWFEGATEHYEEMPRPPKKSKDPMEKGEPPSPELQAYYERAAKIRQKKREYQLKIE